MYFSKIVRLKRLKEDLASKISSLEQRKNNAVIFILSGLTGILFFEVTPDLAWIIVISIGSIFYFQYNLIQERNKKILSSEEALEKMVLDSIERDTEQEKNITMALGSDHRENRSEEIEEKIELAIRDARQKGGDMG